MVTDGAGVCEKRVCCRERWREKRYNAEKRYVMNGAKGGRGKWADERGKKRETRKIRGLEIGKGWIRGGNDRISGQERER